jgi:subtilisin family serine protease
LSGKPKHIKNNIIIRFNKEAVNVNTYLNKKIKAGPASLFIDSLALNEMSIKTGIVWDNFRCFKIHSTFGPKDSLSITRVGDTIPTNDFWTALLVEAPSDISESTLIDSLLTIHDFIRTASINSIFFTSSVPNDTYYPLQYGLFQNDSYPNADINVETAWLNEVGNENIKVGVIDYLIDYYHPDFGDGTYQGSKVRGYSCLIDQDISIYQTPPYNSHGTAVGGIIGALRNNGIGIAGIAGGDVQASNKGVSLYSFVVFNNFDSNGAESIDVIEALALGNLSTTDNNGYGVHIQNMSFGATEPDLLDELIETLKEGFKNGCAYVAGRGNKGYSTNAVEFPACNNNDKVIMNVIASGTNGNRKTIFNGANQPFNWESSYGYVCPLGNCVSCDKVDFMAPGTIELIKTTLSSNGIPLPYPSCELTSQLYGCFNGTSAAAPHVTGTAALMMSKHQPSNGYPNRLISEDLERILEKNTFSQTPAFSLQSGYGRINAGAALTKVTDPYYIKHVKVPVSTIQSLGISNGSFTVYNNYFGVPTGNYNKVETFKCTWNQTDNLISGHNIIDYWKMEALTQLGSIFQSPPPTAFMVGGNIIQNENLQVNVGGNSSSFSGVTHTYKLTNLAGVSYWFPAPPSGLNYTYSLHVLKQADASVSELADDNFIIFPNPAKNEIEIQLKNNYEGEVKVEIVDEIGRVVVNTLYKKDSNKKINVSHLKDGVYFCNLVYGDFVATKTFIKTK